MKGTDSLGNTNMQNQGLLEQHEIRMEALEMRITYQEDWLEKLDTRIIEQEHQIKRLEHLNRLLTERLREQSDADAQETQWRLQDERPPHY